MTHHQRRVFSTLGEKAKMNSVPKKPNLHGPLIVGSMLFLGSIIFFYFFFSRTSFDCFENQTCRIQVERIFASTDKTAKRTEIHSVSATTGYKRARYLKISLKGEVYRLHFRQHDMDTLQKIAESFSKNKMVSISEDNRGPYWLFLIFPASFGLLLMWTSLKRIQEEKIQLQN